MLSPILIQDVRNTRCGNTCCVNRELTGKAVVVELYTGMTLIVSYHIVSD